MKVTSAFIRATQTHTIPKPDPWEPVPRSEWVGGVISPRWKEYLGYKYQQYVYQDGQWVYQDEWHTNRIGMDFQRVTGDDEISELIKAGDYQGMVPGLFFPSNTGTYHDPDTPDYPLAVSLGSGEAFAGGTITYTSAAPTFVVGWGLTPGTYMYEIVRYHGRPQAYHYNGKLYKTIKVEGLKQTYYEYGPNDKFFFDPEVKEFEGYKRTGRAPYRPGHVVTLTEQHIFDIVGGWNTVLFDTIGLATFCDGIRHVEYDIDGETETHGMYGGSPPALIYLIECNLFRLKQRGI